MGDAVIYPKFVREKVELVREYWSCGLAGKGHLHTEQRFAERCMKKQTGKKRPPRYVLVDRNLTILGHWIETGNLLVPQDISRTQARKVLQDYVGRCFQLAAKRPCYRSEDIPTEYVQRVVDAVPRWPNSFGAKDWQQCEYWRREYPELYV